jgi:hypothetical protein
MLPPEIGFPFNAADVQLNYETDILDQINTAFTKYMNRTFFFKDMKEI